MAVKTIYSFDVLPGAFTAAGGLNVPVNLNGLAPYTTDYKTTLASVGTTDECMGVTGLAEDKFIGGANALVFYARRTQDRPRLVLTGTDRPVAHNISFRYTLGLRFKIGLASAANMQFDNSIMFFTAGGAILTLSPTLQLLFLGTATGISLARGEEHYYEVTLEHNGSGTASNYVPTWTLAVDGTVVATRNSVVLGAAFANLNYTLGPVSTTLNTTADYRRWCYADIYVTDQIGDAPFNGRLGPQRVKVNIPSVVTNSAWTPSTGTDQLPLINDHASATSTTSFVTAPVNDSPLTLRFNFADNPNAIVNGVFVFATAKRDDGATRNLRAEMARGDGTVLSSPAAVVLTNAYVTRCIASFAPSNAAEALDYRNTPLRAATFALKAPTT